ncbi:phosphatidylinositol 3-kinase [Planoprotostelium fungivorum]|uniref:Phosphatidylinositol 3-kinase n=1 Tax=Planoprotostelium fungivorum TaxID=1890364 RepID=A0A2P6NRT4_9EUKA|nr:phosphatidylinositol 3-kinase [Planoprotostelium fungivorum]
MSYLQRTNRSSSLSRIQFKVKLTLPDGGDIVCQFPMLATVDQVKTTLIKSSTYLSSYPPETICLGVSESKLFHVSFVKFVLADSQFEREIRDGHTIHVMMFEKRANGGIVSWMPVGLDNHSSARRTGTTFERPTLPDIPERRTRTMMAPALPTRNRSRSVDQTSDRDLPLVFNEPSPDDIIDRLLIDLGDDSPNGLPSRRPSIQQTILEDEDEDSENSDVGSSTNVMGSPKKELRYGSTFEKTQLDFLPGYQNKKKSTSVSSDDTLLDLNFTDTYKEWVNQPPAPPPINKISVSADNIVRRKKVDHVEDIKKSTKKKAGRVDATAHIFQAQSIIAPVTCDLCATYIIGITSQCFACESCNYTVHKRCVAFAPKSCQRINLRTARSQDHSNSTFPNAEDAFAHPDKAGFLSKQGHVARSWKRRWFVLKGPWLYYLKTEDATLKGTRNFRAIAKTLTTGDLCGVPMGVIPLSDCLVAPIEGKRYGFTIYCKNKNYPIVADSWDDMESWVNAIRKIATEISLRRVAPLIEKHKAFPLTNVETELVMTERPRESQDLIMLSDLEPSPLELEKKEMSFGLSRFDWAQVPLYYQDLSDLHTEGTDIAVPQLSQKALDTLRFSRQNFSAEVDMETRDFVLRIRDLVSANAIRNDSKVLTAARVDGHVITIPPHYPTRFLVFFRFSPELEKSVVCSPAMTLDYVVGQVMSKLQFSSFCNEVNSNQDLYLKIVGCEEYLQISNVVMYNILYVREAVLRAKRVSFHVLEKKSIPAGVSFPWEPVGKMDMGKSIDRAVTFNRFRLAEIGLTRRTSRSSVRISDKRQVYHSVDISRFFEIRVMGFHFLPLDILYQTWGVQEVQSGNVSLFLEIGLSYGMEPVCPFGYTKKVQLSVQNIDGQPKSSALWAEWLTLDTKISQIPREARITITLYATKNKEMEPYELMYGGNNLCEALAWVTYPVVDVQGSMVHRILTLSMWVRGKANPIATPINNPIFDGFSIILEFPDTPHPIVFPLESGNVREKNTIITPTKNQQDKLDEILDRDSLSDLSKSERDLVWNYRRHIINTRSAYALSKVVRSVPWRLAQQMDHLAQLLEETPHPPPIQCLELLDSNFPSVIVRNYAVRGLKTLSDEGLKEYMPQLVQVLKYENHHFSHLVFFLLQRAFRNRRVVGQQLFWLLKAELHIVEISMRFRLILEALLLGCNDFQEELINQVDVINVLQMVSTMVKSAPASKRSQVLTSELLRHNFPRSFSLPILPTVRLTGLCVDKCRFLDSSTFPILLVLQNEDPYGPPIQIMFKNGDDLRQDALTIQMIKIMDRLWRDNELNLHLTVYEVLPTGENCGLIEIVANSKTVADIQKAHGGVTSAFKKTPLYNHITQNNRSTELYKLAVRNFTLSLAAYSVLTFVLGISDRHNDNVMISDDGHLFHIDFGYIMGNIMKFGVFKRETAPFVLTPEMIYVMQSEKSENYFDFYVRSCGQAFNLLRKNADIFLTLFSMMVSTGLPQIKRFEDIYYIRGAFVLDKTEEEAAEYFADLIHESLSTTRTRVNNAIHIWAHPD